MNDGKSEVLDFLKAQARVTDERDRAASEWRATVDEWRTAVDAQFAGLRRVIALQDKLTDAFEMRISKLESEVARLTGH